MKVFNTILFVIIFLNTNAQLNIIEHMNSSELSYEQGKLDTCAIYNDSIYQVYPLFHHMLNSNPITFTLSALKKDEKAINYIEISSKLNLSISPIYKSIFNFLKIKNASKENLKNDRVEVIKSIITIDTNYYASIYAVLSYLDVKSKINLTKEESKYLLNNLIKGNKNISDVYFKEIKSLKQYLLIFLEYELYNLHINTSYKVLKYEYTSLNSSEVKMFDLSELNGNLRPVIDVKKELLKKNFKLKDSIHKNLLLGLDLISISPSQKNYNWLKDQSGLSQVVFNKFWKNNISSSWLKFLMTPNISNFIDSIVHEPKWIVIDVWGTWCKPCVSELPDFEKMYQTFNLQTNIPIQFLSLSYNSVNLNQFMDVNNYHFPVLEITKEDVDFLNISNYPTTFLISPDFKYTILTSRNDKTEVIEVLTLTKWD